MNVFKRKSTTMFQKMSVFLFCTGILLIFSQDIYAATIKWEGSVSTDWANPFNWDTYTVPTSTDEAFIQNGTNQPTLSANTEVEKLNIQGNSTLIIAAGVTLTVSKNGVSNNIGVIIVNGTIELFGTIDIENTPQSGILINNNSNNNLNVKSTGEIYIDNINTSSSTVHYALRQGGGTITVDNGGEINTGTSNSVQFRGLSIAGTLDNSGTITINNTTGTDGAGIVNSGTITNSGAIDIDNTTGTNGSGIVNFTSGTITNSGAIDIGNTDGDGIVNRGTITNSGAIDIGLSGSISGKGIFLDSSGIFAVNIEGISAGVSTGYGQVDVVGDIELSTLSTPQTLSLSGSYTPLTGNEFTIINNDGVDAISGTFNGLAEGATITFNAVTLYITYVGGDGNDVVLSLINPLPVELMAFTAKVQDNQTNLLEWQTASEENNDGFEIQKSIDGKSWKNIGTVEGNGTTVEISNYNFIDESPFDGMNYYRLKQLDFDGQFEYSNIVNIQTVEQSNNQTLKVYPNPVQDNLTIEEGRGIVTIYNMLGQPVLEITNSESQTTINVSDLPKGQYLLRILKTDGTIVTQQFMK
jgi:hypothetical protein